MRGLISAQRHSIVNIGRSTPAAYQTAANLPRRAVYRASIVALQNTTEHWLNAADMFRATPLMVLYCVQTILRCVVSNSRWRCLPVFYWKKKKTNKLGLRSTWSNVFMIWYYDHEVTITRCRSSSFRPPWSHLLIVLCLLLYKWHNVLVYIIKFKCYVNRIGECG